MFQKVNDPGFGNFSAKNIRRYVNKNGTFNIKHLNKKNTISAAYAYLISIKWSKFFFLVLLSYTLLNVLFAALYITIGIEYLTPSTGSFWRDFLNAFFFSAQTITTVGYGGISPSGIVTGLISSFEAMMGLLCFSFITGLLYGRFSKPKASVVFSDAIVYRSFKDKHAIMFRVMNSRRSIMIRPSIDVTLLLSKKATEQEYRTDFYKLKLERESITYLPTTWTVVHEIDNNSPLNDYSEEELKDLHGEFVILITYFDENFNQEVHQVHSYLLSEIQYNYQFEKAFTIDDDGTTVFDHDKFNSIIPKI